MAPCSPTLLIDGVDPFAELGQRTPTDDASQVRHAEALAARIVTWLRGEEVDASLANREL